MLYVIRLAVAYARLALVLSRLVVRPPVFVLTSGGRSSGRVTLRRLAVLRIALSTMRTALALPFAR